MSQNEITLHQPLTDVRPVDTAAIYARVSSFGQLGRDGDEDGYSLPAQVEGA